MTNAEFAILSLIAETPRHGYEIERVIEERGMRDWTEVGFSSIYHILKKLERQGWIQGHAEPSEGRGPARRVYQITERGTHQHRAETLRVLSTPGRSPLPIMLGLSNLPAIGSAEAATALREHCARLQEDRDRVLERARNQAPLPHFVQAMFDLSAAVSEATLEWLREYVRLLECDPALPGNAEDRAPPA